ncbi:MAG: hypothetical protein JXB26_09835 [Candidatus Aminicenantes bacterium]|nr:hypothetical protein [Candidatus Aminicenantes bacterium]
MSIFSMDLLVYVGAAGVFLGILFFLIFLGRRILRLLRPITKKDVKTPGFSKSLRNLVLILIWTSALGMLLFIGFFFRAYHAFTLEELAAEITTEPGEKPETTKITLTRFLPDGEKTQQDFLIRGDQWMIEGDILKWKNMINFLGLHTRYRLTRIRGRYISAENEKKEKPTVYSLVKDENHPFWKYLYRHGHKFPLVSTVYGNAAYQLAEQSQHYRIYVSTSGFVVRKVE